MKINNKKGFTLVELLAVLVVLAVIVLLAVNIINSRVKDARKNSVEVNANNYIKAVNGVAAISQNIGEDMEKGTYQVRDLNKQDIKISGEKPRKGYLVLENYEVTYGCLMYDNYSAVISNGKTSSVDKLNCNDFKVNAEFTYKGSEEVFNVQISGLYKIEAWGAQGGSADDTYVGGYGGYSVGYVQLKKGDKLYINVGGQGTKLTKNESGNGGYNGGGNVTLCLWSSSSTVEYCGTGGGASSVAKSSGLLSTFSLKIDNLLLVAGGGGGGEYTQWSSYYHVIGGSGGGFTGGKYTSTTNNSSTVNSYTAASQSGAGSIKYANDPLYSASFGQGSNSPQSGGGGGFYGGAGTHGGSGGGSGYIGNSKLSNAAMYCYNCDTSNLSTTKTISTSCAEETPTSQCAKKGNGFVKISYSAEVEPTNNVTEFSYTNGEQVLYISKTGTYRLEVWGAQGGSVNSSYYGGYGSYSVGEIKLTKGQKLYINVGGQGSSSMKARLPGGYNGGGAAHGADCGTNTNRYGSSGGGATSIATVSGQLPTLEKYKGTLNNNGTSSDTTDDYYESNNILIVAGGGGGASSINNWYTGSGGAAGGILGTRGFHSNAEHPDYTYGGSQTSGGRGGSNWKAFDDQTEFFKTSSTGSFGQGGTQANIECQEGGSGGGGFFGGGAGSQTSGGGGSGYIANPSLTNKKMVVYSSSDTYVSNATQTKTERTTSVSANPTPNYPKSGNGYAIITLLD